MVWARARGSRGPGRGLCGRLPASEASSGNLSAGRSERLSGPPSRRSPLDEPEPAVIPGQEAMPLRPFQPTLWSL